MHPLAIPIWAEGRIAFERAALRRDPVLRGHGVPLGDGGPVLLIPGFLAGDLSLAPMASWLRHIGYAPCRAGIRANVDCSARAVRRLEAQLQHAADRHGRPVTIVGHSRGGALARVLAVRAPDRVERIVCLGSPLTDQLAVHPLVRAQVEMVAALGSLGLHGLFTRDCHLGDCCAEVREQASAPFPSGMGFVSIYSRSDGIVDWRTCLDPAAEAVEVRSSHCGMAVNAEVYRAIGRALAPAVPVTGRRSRVRAVRAPQALAA
jgi:pimeloyl-ACP methyl ester carboxylesterase